MKLLLDTHIWIWSAADPWKLSSKIQGELANPDNELWISPVSIWELILLAEKKRIELKPDVGQWVEESKHDLGFQEASFTSEVAKELRFTLLGHRDPADRFLVATAKVYDLTLVTADERLLDAPGIRVLPNR